MNVTFSNAHQILEVKPDATTDEIRKAYLNLVRQNPPDREPDKFRNIHAAYQMLNDPIAIATALLTPSREKPDLVKAVAEAEKIRPRIATLNLLALGNQE